MPKLLVIVDIQNDFCPGGSLAVAGGDQIVQPVNEIQKDYDEVIACRDWHLKDHCSFQVHGGIWPVHCVMNTPGAEYHKDLKVPAKVFNKGDNQAGNGYSAGENADFLKHCAAFTEIDVVGIAFDFCVKDTAIDIKKAVPSAKVAVLQSLTRAVYPDKDAETAQQLTAAGVAVK